MEKANVMKALTLCGTGSETCTGCPYYGMDGCDRHVCDDALTLLKANEKANGNHTYHTAIIYTKRDNLLKWLQHNYKIFGTHGSSEEANRIRMVYNKANDCFIYKGYRNEGSDIFKGKDIRGKHLYPIGTAYWMWDKAD